MKTQINTEIVIVKKIYVFGNHKAENLKKHLFVAWNAKEAVSCMR